MSKPKSEYLIKKSEDAGMKHLKNPNAFTEYSNTMDDYNPSRKRKKLIVFGDMIADIMANKRFHAIMK